MGINPGIVVVMMANGECCCDMMTVRIAVQVEVDDDGRLMFNRIFRE